MTKVHINLRIANATFHLLVFIMQGFQAICNSTGCIATFNLLHRAVNDHDESEAERVFIGDGQCR